MEFMNQLGNSFPYPCEYSALGFLFTFRDPVPEESAALGRVVVLYRKLIQIMKHRTTHTELAACVIGGDVTLYTLF